jgi:Lon protease-like protein
MSEALKIGKLISAKYRNLAFIPIPVKFFLTGVCRVITSSPGRLKMKLPSEVPVMTLPNAILFPGAMLPLYIYEKRYQRMLSDALHSHRMFAVAMQKSGCKREIPSQVAGLGLIRVAVTRPDATSYVIVQGLARVALKTVVRHRPYRLQRMHPMENDEDPAPPLAPLTRKLRTLVVRRIEQGLNFPEAAKPLVKDLDSEQWNSMTSQSMQHFVQYLDQLEDAGQIADLVTCTLLPNPQQRQTVLETVKVEHRLMQVIRFLKSEIQHKRKQP